MDLEKLKETLKANGVEEEKIDKILADLAEEKEGDDEPKEPQAEGEEPKEEGDVPPATNETVEPTDVPPVEEVVVPNEEGDVPQEGDVPPVPPTEEEAAPTEVPPTEVPPQDVPPVPPFDPTELFAKIDELKGVNDEQAKTIEGLVARVKSLEDALANAGVLERTDDENGFGIDETRIPESGSVEAQSAMSSALAKLNGHKH